MLDVYDGRIFLKINELALLGPDERERDGAPPSAHLGGLLLPSPLEPFHVVDLVHLNLERLLQRS